MILGTNQVGRSSQIETRYIKMKLSGEDMNAKIIHSENSKQNQQMLYKKQ